MRVQQLCVVTNKMTFVSSDLLRLYVGLIVRPVADLEV